ncbi:uncharacterized protein [Bemisia tabaci]|uniref:uncharacterized protein isoform X2 n=1 Tax=Bemisia tabaci TaxID=7038 RepID=UPI003B27C729
MRSGKWMKIFTENEGISLRQEDHRVAPQPCPIRLGSRGRGSFIIDPKQVKDYRQAGMSWTEIAATLCVSRKTLYNHCREIQLEERLSDAEVNEIIDELKAEDPRSGESYVGGEIRARGHHVSRERVRKLLRLKDPLGTAQMVQDKTIRKVYHVKGPNYMWHLDGNLKLVYYGIYVYGIVDGFSRKVMALEVGNNKTASAVGGCFLRAVRRFGVPERIRSDKGGENVDAATLMLQIRGTRRGSFITGRSVHNTRIERFWGEVNRITLRFRKLFLNLCLTNKLDVDNDLDLFSLQYVFIPVIQETLYRFERRYDCHKIRTGHSKTPKALYMSRSKAPVFGFDCPSYDEDNLVSLPCEEANEWLTHAESLCPNPSEIKYEDSVDVYHMLRSFLKHLYQ